MAPTAVPDFVTHYYSGSDRPFRNLSDLDGDALVQVLQSLKDRKAANPAFQRVFGGRYMALRRETEAKMRALFIAGGGQPERTAPHYFVLGTCSWFEGLYPDTRHVRIDLSDLPLEVTSFTYPDSFVAMRLGVAHGLPPDEMRPYHDTVFGLEDLADIVSAHGLPDGSAVVDYSTYHTQPFEKYIEVQVWADAPVAAYL